MKKLKLLSIVLLSLFIFTVPAYAAVDSETFMGDGTQDVPYVISTPDDLLSLAEQVNSGNHFSDKFFRQETDISLAGIEWTPIGEFGTENHFDGTYDGDGHCIENISVPEKGNCGLFGQLGGIVMNLGVESGEISGACVGSISSHAGTGNARIINCYNKAAVHGHRAGGIADNFNGMIVGCWNAGDLSGDMTGTIVSYGAKYMSCCYEGVPTAEELNHNLITVATDSGVHFRDLNMWVQTDDGAVFSQEKRSIVFRDIPIIFVANLPYIIPAVLALSLSICLVVIVMNAAQQKRRGQHA